MKYTVALGKPQVLRLRYAPLRMTILFNQLKNQLKNHRASSCCARVCV